MPWDAARSDQSKHGGASVGLGAADGGELAIVDDAIAVLVGGGDEARAVGEGEVDAERLERHLCTRTRTRDERLHRTRAHAHMPMAVPMRIP